MKRAIAAALVALVITGPAWGYDSKGKASYFGPISCGENLDAYSRATLNGTEGFTGPYKTWAAFEWINGYLTAYNRNADNGKESITGLVSINDYR
jgi:hypothetical protein